VPVNVPPVFVVNQVLPELRTFFTKLFAVRAIPPGTRITSWWRSVQSNQAAGGNPRSQHLVGLAFDLASPDPVSLVNALRDVGLVAVHEVDHVHVQAFPAGTINVARYALL